MKIDLQEQLDKAIALLADEKTDRNGLNDAEDIFNALLNLDKKSAILLFYLASTFTKKKYHALAILMYKQALELDEKFGSCWNNLGFVYKQERELDKAKDCFKKSVELSPDDADCLMNYGSMFVASGTPDKAIKILDRVLKKTPDHYNARWNRSLCLLEKGEYEKGWHDYDAGVRISDRQERNYHRDGTPKWDGVKDKNKTVVVYGEQGIGDEIMFASMLPDMINDCNVIFDAHPRLYELFRASFPSIPVYGTRKDGELAWPHRYKIDARISIGSLGQFYRNKKSDFPQTPYLIANPYLCDVMGRRLNEMGSKIKIGISWKGGTKQTNAENRTLSLDQWLPLFKALDVDFISLQYMHDAEREITKFESEHAIQIHHWPQTIRDYDETAALVSQLDMVISVPQSVVHLAGALGTPTLQLTPKHALWQMGVYGEDMPWYGCVKSLWQTKNGVWDDVLEKAQGDVCNLLAMSIAS